MDEPVRPIDILLERLSRADGAEWLESALQNGPASAFGSARTYLADGQASLEQLSFMKQQSKRLLADRQDSPSRLRATIGYFFSIASALAHYQEVITARSSQELRPVLDDLAAVTPPTWSAMFQLAAASLAAKSDRTVGQNQEKGT